MRDGREKTEGRIPDATGWQPALDACPEVTGCRRTAEPGPTPRQLG